MEDLFPLDTGISRVRGVISILKQNKGHMEISRLAEEADEQLDDLLPLINACKLLGFATVDDAEIKLTQDGARLTFSNFSKSIHDGLEKVEPFRSTLKILRHNEVSTAELFSALNSKGIILHDDQAVSDALLKKLLIRWGVRSKLLNYNSEADVWSIRR